MFQAVLTAAIILAAPSIAYADQSDTLRADIAVAQGILKRDKALAELARRADQRARTAACYAIVADGAPLESVPESRTLGCRDKYPGIIVTPQHENMVKELRDRFMNERR